jgi:hypothetical protein
MVSRSVADFIVELRVIVGVARVATGWVGGVPPETLVVRATVPLKFMTLVTLTVEVALELGPRMTVNGFAVMKKSGPITWMKKVVELEKLPLVPVTKIT